MKILCCIVLLTISICCDAQGFRKCIVYQFAGKDSVKKHIVLTQTFNRKGQVVSETYSNYQSSSSEGNSDGTYYYYYKNSLLDKKVFVQLNNDTNKVLYYYNSNHQCVKEEYYTYERRVKKEAQKGLGQAGGCIVLDKDLEKNRSWIKSNQVTFLYDDKDRLIKKTDQLDYTRSWKYDQLNRIIQEKGFDFDKLAYAEDYVYFKGGYKSTQIFYDTEAKPKPATYSDIIFNPVFTATCYLNHHGKIIKKEITTEKGIKISNEISCYDSNGRIVKTIHQYLDKHYVSKNKPSQITHIFEYK